MYTLHSARSGNAMKLKCGFAFSHSRAHLRSAVLFGFVHIHKILVHESFHFKPNLVIFDNQFVQESMMWQNWPILTEFKTD